MFVYNDALYKVLPLQATTLRLVGYKATISVPEHLAKIKRELHVLIMDKELYAQGARP